MKERRTKERFFRGKGTGELNTFVSYFDVMNKNVSTKFCTFIGDDFYFIYFINFSSFFQII